MGVFFATVAAFIALSLSAFAAPMQVTFNVEVPPHFKDTDGIYLAGDHPALGAWQSDGLQLERTQNPHVRRVRFAVDGPLTLEYKFTLGTWETAEVSLTNKEIKNRRLFCSQSCTRNVSIANFRLKPFHPWPQSTNGRIEYFHDWIFPGFQNRRSIAVYLPPNYGRTKTRYPVIYAMDGQNLFDTATASFGVEWRMDETLDELIQKKEIPPVIVVGVYSTEQRAEEYLMNPTYLNWIARDVKSFIDRRYPTLSEREYTTLLGSSFGGVFAFFGAWKRPDVFSRFGAMSTAYWWNNFAVERMARTQQIPLGPRRFWMDMGDKEDGTFSKGVEEMNRVYAVLSGQKKWPAAVLKQHVTIGGTHSEASWAARLDQVLLHLLGAEAWKK